MLKGQKGLMPRRIHGMDFMIETLSGPRGGTRVGCLLMGTDPIASVTSKPGSSLFEVHVRQRPTQSAPDKPCGDILATQCVSLKQARFVCWKFAEEFAERLKRDLTRDTLTRRCKAMHWVLVALGMTADDALVESLKPAASEAPVATPPIETGPTLAEEAAHHEADVLDHLKRQTASLYRFFNHAVEAERCASECDGFPQHSAFDALRRRIALGGIRNYLLVGPAGSGKTTLAKNLASDLGLPFDLMSITAGVTESHLLGRILPPKYELVPSPFVRIYSEGGVFLLDEVDAADPNVLLTVNSALANGMLVTPDGKTWKRHPDTYILAAANTWGKGAERGYSGRNQLDRSTRDRFTLKSFEMDYCSTMEAGIARKCLAGRLGDRLAVIATTMAIRNAASEKRIEETVSARFVEEASTFIANGATLEFCVHELLTPWSPTDREKVADISREVCAFAMLCKRLAARMEECK